MSKSLQEISKIINEFVEKRGWGKYNTPNNMISSILIELGELAEHYQWRFDYEEWDEEKKKIVGFEFVDVFFLLMGLANRSGIDIEKYLILKD